VAKAAANALEKVGERAAELSKKDPVAAKKMVNAATSAAKKVVSASED